MSKKHKDVGFMGRDSGCSVRSGFKPLKTAQDNPNRLVKPYE